MGRGPKPCRALKAAIPIAKQRGMIQVAGNGPENLYDFAIVSTVPVAFIRVKYAARILASPAEIAAEFREVILALQAIPYDSAISHELWLCSKHGTVRFFRILTDRLIELGQDGQPRTG